MKKNIVSSLLLAILFSSLAYADVATKNVIIKETDGSPSGVLRELTVTNDTLTNNSGGKFAVTTGGGGAPSDADYLVGTANASLSAEIVAGTTPGGELGGTWASPTVDSGIHDDEYLKLVPQAPLTGALTINTNSTTALLVEQDGVRDNTLVVDTTNGQVGINVVPSATVFRVATNDSAPMSFEQYISVVDIAGYLNLRRSLSDVIGTFTATSDTTQLGQIGFHGTNLGATDWAQAGYIRTTQSGSAGATYNGGIMDLVALDTNAAATQFRLDGVIRDFVLGNGRIASTPLNVLLGVTGGVGTNKVGANFTIAGGKATGNAVGGSLLFQTSNAGSSGTTAQTLSTKWTINQAGSLLSGIDGTSTYSILTTGTLGAGAITGTSFIIGANTLDTNEWAFLDGQDQAVKTTSSPTFVTAKLTNLTDGYLPYHISDTSGFANSPLYTDGTVFTHSFTGGNATQIGYIGTILQRHTTTGTYYTYNYQQDQRISVADTKTNSGNALGFFTNVLRNYDTGAASDGGTQQQIIGLHTSIGHLNSTPAWTPVTNYVTGVSVLPYIMTGTIGTFKGLHLASAVTGGAITNYWGVYQEDSNAKNYFAGNVGIGTISPDRLLHPELADAVTNVVTYPARLTHITSGTPANSIGVGLEFEQETTANNNEVIATIEAVVTDVTATSEDADLVFKTITAGAAATEKVRITSLGAIVLTGVTADPANPADGSIWYRSDTDEYRCQANGVTYRMLLNPV